MNISCNYKDTFSFREKQIQPQKFQKEMKQQKIKTIQFGLETAIYHAT